MADEFSRNKRYQYGANSNLVLEAERDGRRRDEEGKGEVETLNGKLGDVRMGDRLKYKSRLEMDEHIGAGKLKRQKLEKVNGTGSNSRPGSSFFTSKGATVLSQTEDMDTVTYKPKTRETKIAYEELLRLVQQIIGDQPHDILKGAADEILAVLKDDSFSESSRQREIEKLTARLSADKYYNLVNVGKNVTDYRTTQDTTEKESVQVDEEMAVIFDDEDEDGDGPGFEEVHDSEGGEDDDGDEEAVEAEGKNRLKGRENNGRAAVDQDTEDDPYIVSVHELDAHWLQRQLSKYYSDANTSASLAEETLHALKILDERMCENKLVVLLDYDKFDFIKLLMKNRAKIYYCLRLKQAQNDAERVAIEEEMLLDQSGIGAQLLQTLKQKASAESWTQDRIGEFANKARREARALNKDGETASTVGTKSGEDGDYDHTFVSSTKLSQKLQSEEPQQFGSSETTLDLDDLVFADGGHMMSNKRCELPDKSWRAQKKGYEEVHVPALRPVVPSTERLVRISELPDWTQPAFDKIQSLNRIQSKMMRTALFENHNMLLCAPTGAGKTNVALMCMLNQLGTHRRSDGSFDLDAFKIVYIAPMKALVQEIVQSFGKRLAPLGVKVNELSGDQNLTRQQIQDTQVIVTTPEKWDIITRKSGDRTYTQLVRLIIIDEIHLLHDDRGPVLESIVARSIRQIESTQEMIRIVGLSATLPNYEDVATFLRVEPEKGLFFFDNSFRPVPLQQQYIGVTEKKALKRFQLMNEICYEKVLQQAGKNQVLIFTHSRAETAKTAKALRDMAVNNDTTGRFVREDSASSEILKVEAATAKNPDLVDLLPYGFAIHHAGMGRSDRSLVEALFADRHVQVLVSTATLAWGVNLPCHTVIIKGTQMYSPEQGRWTELSPLDIMQMLGRAGRYGLDSEGEGIIITAHSELQYYLSLMNQQLPIESQFIKKLPDMLNAEVVMGSVTSIREAAAWLGYTYLFVRMMCNPTMYGIDADDASAEPSLLQRRLDLSHSAAVVLDKHDLVKYDRKTGALQSTVLGRVASHYYIAHESINVFKDTLKPSMTEIEIFRLFSLSGEFKQLHVREEEKLELAKLMTRVPIPVKEAVDEPSAKVNILLQAYVSRLKLEGFALVADMTFVQQSACRLMRALFEIALKRGWASLAMKLLSVCIMVERRVWASQSPLRQFGNLPESAIARLEKNSDINWSRYYDLKPQDFGEMIKMPKMGSILYKYVHMFPKMILNAQVLPVTRSLLRIDLSITADFEFNKDVHGQSLLFWLIVEDVDGERMLHHEPFMLQARNATVENHVNFTVAIQDPLPPQYFVKIVSDRWLHSEVVLPVSFRHLILPQKFPPSTELLDLQPLPVAAFRNEAYERLFGDFTVFNSIQTQTFTSLYESDSNVLVCAPSGAGKTVCAELAILRLFSNSPKAKCVYIAPKMEIVNTTFKCWHERLTEALGVNVVKLTGEVTTDLNLLEMGDVILASSTHWDMLSRRWKQRKVIQNIDLFLFDEMHLIGSADGPTFEVTISRARFVASQLECSQRFIGLSSSLANAKDVGDWIGAPSSCIYNFGPDIRPVSLDIHMQSFDMSHFSSRLLAMAKPIYSAITKHSPGKPVIVFVPSRKQAQLSAIDLLSYASASGNPQMFVPLAYRDSIDFQVAGIRDSSLLHACTQGVGFLHPGLCAGDKEIVERLFSSSEEGSPLQVLVVPQSMCWMIQAMAHMVIVMDTVYYEGREHRYVDYPICDILQMVGRSSRQVSDLSAKCLILCHSSKREYLRRMLHDPLAIESHLDHYLHDHINAEVVSKTIENKPDAVDYLTWTLYYRRLFQNPNYYNLQGTSHRHVSDHLSELIENTISDLEESKCLAVEEDEIDLSPLNLGMIASHYYIEYTTVELFASSVNAKTKVKGITEILASSSEFSHMSIRQNEDRLLGKIGRHLPHSIPEATNIDDPATKALILLQSHFSRIPISGELVADQSAMLPTSVKLIQALVDVISSHGWLKPALAAMETSQMIVQGLWNKDSNLKQVPHFTSDIIERLQNLEEPVENVFDLIDMDDEERNLILQCVPEKLSDIAMFCNAYPNVELSYELGATDGEVVAGDSVVVKVRLAREIDEDISPDEVNSLGTVVCPRYTDVKRECWWLVVGDPRNNTLLSIKRIALVKDTKV